MKVGKQKMRKLGISLLHLIQIGSVESVVKIGSDHTQKFLTTDGSRMGDRIDPMHSGGIFDHEGHEVARRVWT